MPAEAALCLTQLVFRAGQSEVLLLLYYAYIWPIFWRAHWFKIATAVMIKILTTILHQYSELNGFKAYIFYTGVTCRNSLWVPQVT